MKRWTIKCNNNSTIHLLNQLQVDILAVVDMLALECLTHKHAGGTGPQMKAGPSGFRPSCGGAESNKFNNANKIDVSTLKVSVLVCYLMFKLKI